jgi:hypothetical protein
MLAGLRGSNPSSSSNSSSSLLRLYQLLPPRLAARAALFGSRLAVGEDWKQLEPGFFAAPGEEEGFKRCEYVMCNRMRLLGNSIHTWDVAVGRCGLPSSVSGALLQ